MADIRALIVDDEPLARRGVRQLLAGHRDVLVVGECRNGREAIRALDSAAVDLLFLDVQMPGIDGFGVLSARLGKPMPYVVFITAFDSFAVRAFEAHALDYLVKPLGPERFDRTLARVRERMRLAEADALAARVADLLGAPRAGISVTTATGQLLLAGEDIDWVEARDYYAGVHAAGKRHLVRESLASLEHRLDPRTFFRIHRSALVNLDRIRELAHDGGGETVAVLRDGTRIPVSRRRRERLATLLRRPKSSAPS